MTYDNLNDSSMSIANMETTSQSSMHARACPLSSNSDDLRRQIEKLKDVYPRFQIISDIASEIINLKRPGLCSLLDTSHEVHICIISCHSSDYIEFN